MSLEKHVEEISGSQVLIFNMFLKTGRKLVFCPDSDSDKQIEQGKCSLI